MYFKGSASRDFRLWFFCTKEPICISCPVHTLTWFENGQKKAHVLHKILRKICLHVCPCKHVRQHTDVLPPSPRRRIDPQPNDCSPDGSRPQPLGIGGHTSGSVQFPVMSCYCMHVHALQRQSVSKLLLRKKSLCYPKSQLAWHCPFYPYILLYC